MPWRRYRRHSQGQHCYLLLWPPNKNTEPWFVQKPVVCAGKTYTGNERQMWREAHGQTHSNQSKANHIPRLRRHWGRRVTPPHPNRKCISLTEFQTKKKDRYLDPPFCSSQTIYKMYRRPSSTLKEKCVCACLCLNAMSHPN